MRSCAIGGCDQAHRDVCPTCVHWTPSTGSRYYFCALYSATRETCDLPRRACASCEYYEGDEAKRAGPGRPNMSGIDWSDPKAVRRYYRDKMRARRAARRRTVEI